MHGRKDGETVGTDTKGRITACFIRVSSRLFVQFDEKV